MPSVKAKNSPLFHIVKLLNDKPELLKYFLEVTTESQRYKLVREECPAAILRTLYPDSEENYDTGYECCSKGWKKFYREQIPFVLDELIDKELLERSS